jgi:hypothetical protein
MFVRIRRQNTNQYISVNSNRLITLAEDNKSGHDNRWRLTSNRIQSVKYPGLYLSAPPHLRGKLALEGGGADTWHYPGAQWKQIKRNSTNHQCIDGNVQSGGELFLWNCGNVINHQWFFEYTVPPIETHNLSLGRILNRAVVQFIFKERQLFVQTVSGNEFLVANSVFPDTSSEFLLEQEGDKNDSIFFIRIHGGNYVYMTGGRVRYGTLDTEDPAFRFKIVPNGNNLYTLQGLKPGEGFVRTANNMWSGDNGLYRTDNNRDPWAQLYINVISQTQYADFVHRGTENPKWCCGVEYGDDAAATQACTDIGYIPSQSKCDNWMTNYCQKNPTDPACACLISQIPLPQCLDLKCANNPRSYRNVKMLAECKNLSYTDCSQAFNVGSANDVSFDRNNFNQMCGNVFTDGQMKPNLTETGLSTSQWIIIIIGLLILVVLIGLGIGAMSSNNQNDTNPQNIQLT